jgi:RNA polymerase sigma-70 factor (ECF subfamily)
VQQTCIEAVEAIARFQGEAEPQFSAWLKQILRRNVTNLIRDNRAAKRDVRKESPLIDQDGSASLCWFEPAADGSSPSARLVRGEAALKLAAALEELSEDQRMAVTMRYLEGCSVADIAEQLGRTKPAVAGLLHRTLKALREKLDLP